MAGEVCMMLHSVALTWGPDLAALLCQVPHHQVKQWLHHDRNQHMSGRAYRAHALAELSNSATFNYRSGISAHSFSKRRLLIVLGIKTIFWPSNALRPRLMNVWHQMMPVVSLLWPLPLTADSPLSIISMAVTPP